MRVLVVSDIHANLAAFSAVLQATRDERDLVLCLGDLVGYGPDPNEVVALARESCALTLAGNHDLAACGKLDWADFSLHARTAMEWTRSVLSPESLAFLDSLRPIETYDDLLLSHGSPENPVWRYIFSVEDALGAFYARDFRRCFFGHTHVPSAFALSGGACRAAYGEGSMVVETDAPGLRVLLNPGSVGFPRDAADAHGADSRSAAARYAVYDTLTGQWFFRRVHYDLRPTRERMERLGIW
jgi:diadenosine tetraphosphatase ApaH/serine/threonine PP2A family protein phosphatase